MQLNDITIVLRLRKPWAALDLGITVTKRHWLSYCLLWCILALPFYIVLSLLLPKDYLWASIVIIWWFKPLYERPILFMLSHHLFDQNLSIREVFSQCSRWLFPELLWALTTRRLSTARSFYMSINLLEGLKGKAYINRARILGSRVGSEGFWLTCILIHIEYFLSFSLLIVINNILSLNLFYDMLNIQQSTSFIIISNSFTVFSMAMVAPFFVGCGFILYISRRIELEAWDIELCFKELINKAKK